MAVFSPNFVLSHRPKAPDLAMRCLPVQVGNTHLSRGEYAIKLDGSAAVLVDEQGREIGVKAKVEVAENKFQQTAVGLGKDENGTSHIDWIQLGGSRDKVVFEGEQER